MNDSVTTVDNGLGWVMSRYFLVCMTNDFFLNFVIVR
jgi:hypothetical protein